VDYPALRALKLLFYKFASNPFNRISLSSEICQNKIIMKRFILGVLLLIGFSSHAQTMTQGIATIDTKIWYVLTIKPATDVDAFIERLKENFGAYKEEGDVIKWKGVRKEEFTRNKFTIELRKVKEGDDVAVQMIFINYAGKDMLKPKTEIHQKIVDYFNSKVL
jgi:hypothetical protein